MGGNKGWTPCGYKTKKHRMDFPHFCGLQRNRMLTKMKSCLSYKFKRSRACTTSKMFGFTVCGREIVEQTLQERTSVLIDRKGLHIFIHGYLFNLVLLLAIVYSESVIKWTRCRIKSFFLLLYKHTMLLLSSILKSSIGDAKF